MGVNENTWLNGSCFYFPNPDGNKWIGMYNALVFASKKLEKEYKEQKKFQPKRRNVVEEGSHPATNIGIHHIIPKKVDPGLEKDKRNLLYVPFDDHVRLHYLPWKADPVYAPHLWFIYLAAKKMKVWDLPGGEAEYQELKRDLSLYRTSQKPEVKGELAKVLGLEPENKEN